mgnify:CR=1 FL=1
MARYYGYIRCRYLKEVVIDKLVSKEKVDADDMWADFFGVCAGVIALVVGAALIHIHEWLAV